MTNPNEWEKKVYWREAQAQVGYVLHIGDQYTYIETRITPEEASGIRELILSALSRHDKERMDEVVRELDAILTVFDSENRPASELMDLLIKHRANILTTLRSPEGEEEKG